MQLDIQLPDSDALIQEADKAIALHGSFAIATADQYQDAAAKLQIVKGFAKKWEAMRKELKEPILEAGKRIDELFKPAQTRLTQAETIIKKAVVDYNNELERKRQEEQRKAEEAARKERERIEAEARKAQEAARQKAEQLAKEAAKAAAKGDAEAAAKAQQKAAKVMERAEEKNEALAMKASAVQVAQVAAPAPPKVKGLSMRTMWSARIVNVDLVPREYLIVNEAALNKVAEATKGAIKIPGVEFESRQIAAAGAR